MKSIAAVVVTHNRKEILLENLKSLLNQTCSEKLDIIVIDNGSTDGTFSFIKNLIDEKKILYFNTGVNLGGAGGFNFGVKQACVLQYEYMWLMDDDAIALPETLQELVSAGVSLDGNFGFLSSVVLWKDGKLCDMNRVKYGFRNIDPEKYEGNLIEITHATFVSLFISKKMIARVGLPIKDFFIWGDDVEFTHRIALQYKEPCFLVKSSKIYHYMEKNSGSNIAIDNRERLNRYFYAYRNELFLYRREGLTGSAYFILKCCFNIMRILFKSSCHKIERLTILKKALIAGVQFNPPIEQIELKEF